MVDDGRRTDGRTTEHGYTISSPCEPDGSGELINRVPEQKDLGILIDDKLKFVPHNPSYG